MDKPLILYPGVPSLISGSSLLSDETQSVALFPCWWYIKHKITCSLNPKMKFILVDEGMYIIEKLSINLMKSLLQFDKGADTRDLGNYCIGE